MNATPSSLELIRQISGYGRELFVSNVLKYIGDTFPEVFKKIFAEYLSENLAEFSVKREWRHTDVAVFAADNTKANPCLIIENKVGAATLNEQLEKYSTFVKKSRGRCLLLALREPVRELPQPWVYMSYGTLSKRLDETISGKGFEIEFLKNFAAYLAALNNEVEELNNNITVDLTLAKVTAIAGKHPYGQRTVFETLAKILGERLKNYPLTVSAGIAHATPMLEVVFDGRKKRDMNYTVQIQDNCLVVGYIVKNKGQYVPKYNKPKDEKQHKKENRVVNWKANAPEVLKDLAAKENADTSTGYTTLTYIMPAIRLNRADRKIDEIFKEVEALVSKFSVLHQQLDNNNQ